jgi:hypothetical protein
VAKYYPNIWHFFDCLKTEEVVVRQQLLMMLMGGKQKKNKKTIALQDRIHSLGSLFDQNKIGLGDLLEGLSLLVGMKK